MGCLNHLTFRPVERNCVCAEPGVYPTSSAHTIECDDAFREHFFETWRNLKAAEFEANYGQRTPV